MGADKSAKISIGLILFNEPFVFGQPLVTLLLTAAISYLVTQHSAKADLV